MTMSRHTVFVAIIDILTKPFFENKKMTKLLIKSKKYPKYSLEKIDCEDDKFSCNSWKLSSSCFGGQNE